MSTTEYTTEAKPLFMIKERNRPVQYERRLPEYEPAGVDVISSLGGPSRREKHGPQLWCCNYRLRLSGSGYPQKIPNFSVRKARPEDAALVDAIDQKIADLERQKREAMELAFENGDTVHASEARNYPAKST